LILGISGSVFTQVEIDKSLQLTGGAGDRKITNLELPATGTDAANKDYVEEQIAANSGGSGHVVGELYGGGVVYAVYKDAAGDEHGLVVSLVNNSTGAAWSNVTLTLIGTTNQWNGAANTTAIIGQIGHTSSAAKICDDYTGGSQTDWFLPSTTQLNMLWIDLYIVSQTLAATGGAELMIANLYWSSSENSSNGASWRSFDDGGIYFDPKATSYRVRCVRAF